MPSAGRGGAAFRADAGMKRRAVREEMMRESAAGDTLPMISGWHPAALAATWFGAGLLPKLPGTWGSLAALPFAWIIVSLGGWPALAVSAALVFLLGCWAAGIYSRHAGIDDPGAIVIDEVAGQWLVLLAVPLDLGLYILGFVVFRVFDIWKPWPVRWADRYVKGGVGVMLDDVLAAVYGLVIMAAVAAL